MPQFERTDISLIENEIEKKVTFPKIGEVIQVYEHGQPDDDSNYEVDVNVDGGTKTERKCRVLSTATNTANPPRVGDKVILLYLDGNDDRPYAIGTAWSVSDRAPVGRAGIWRKRFDSGSSPAGDGDLHMTGYTEYDETVATNEKSSLTPQRSLLQIAKHSPGDNVQPSQQAALPAKIEFYDAPADGESTISIEINKDGGGDSDATWGIEFDMSTGGFKLVDANGFGIKSDGSGNFTWSHKSIDMKEESGSTGSLDI